MIKKDVEMVVQNTSKMDNGTYEAYKSIDKRNNNKNEETELEKFAKKHGLELCDVTYYEG